MRKILRKTLLTRYFKNEILCQILFRYCVLLIFLKQVFSPCFDFYKDFKEGFLAGYGKDWD